ncbi:MAG: DUF4367 domain-containing protein [Anaeromicrobium sp.]|jgi:hypothetical protein|uniref:DUF4367 domain-containing protein n=1 Tax=Anaeromicrobium sp. TaxID=1929132 RepID=UPI0025E420AA|nr:DUF4367 domain-containing protein [Anaeromicrobium sp.]MCT4592831.1 DUF4367 domain-containing protein [Anaeromicrobium sp.]
MSKKSIEEEFSMNMDKYLNGIDKKNILKFEEYNELLNLGKTLGDKDFSKMSNKEAVFHKVLKNKKRYRGHNNMKKSNKIRSMRIIAASLAACIITMSSSFGQDLVERIIKTISLDHITVIQTESPKIETWPIPEELKGNVFDENGKKVEEFSRKYNGKYYTVDGEEIADFSNGKIITVSEEEKIEEENTLIVKDSKGLNKYTCFNVILPSYLPEGYKFNRAEFYKDEKGVVSNTKYINLYFIHEKTGKEIFMQQRSADEETAYGMSVDGEIEKVKINDVEAILINDRSIDWEANNVIYGISGGGEITKDELIKIAESIQ